MSDRTQQEKDYDIAAEHREACSDDLAKACKEFAWDWEHNGNDDVYAPKVLAAARAWEEADAECAELSKGL